MVLKLFGATPSGRFATILNNVPVKIFHAFGVQINEGFFDLIHGGP